MKVVMKTITSVLVAGVMLVSPMINAIDVVLADTESMHGDFYWTDPSGDYYDVYIEESGYRLFFLSDNGDGRIVCPASIDGVKVTSLDAFEAYEITLIDVSNNPNLLDLDCSFCPIDSIDVSNNPLLESLDVFNTGVSSLDLSNNPNLEFLCIVGTTVSSLDLSHCPKLIDLDVSCSEISYLDLSACPDLRYLTCCLNNVTSLDISNNPILVNTYLNGEVDYPLDDQIWYEDRIIVSDTSYDCRGRLILDIGLNVVTNQLYMYRLYNPNSGEHFYTGSQEERANLVSVGWNYEGVAWIAPASGAPVYRMFNPNNGDHHYTPSELERDNLIAAGWNYEGIGWYTAPSTGTPLYRLYNSNCTGAGSHHYTSSSEERDYLVSVGWNYEGIGWYGV